MCEASHTIPAAALLRADDPSDESIQPLGPGRLTPAMPITEGTGGLAMMNSNDLRSPLQRMMEEVRSHYEIAYRPTSEKYDGHFRTTAVKVNRPGVKVQSRRGYYALPSLKGQDLLPFELAGMNALSQSPLPKAFPMRSATLQFRASAQSTEVLVAFEVPTRELKTETVTA